MPAEELAEQITTLRKDLFGKRFANATGELEDTAGFDVHGGSWHGRSRVPRTSAWPLSRVQRQSISRHED